MKKTFCTISTTSHLYKSFALADSIIMHGGVLEILLVDKEEIPLNSPENVNFTLLKELKGDLTRQIIEKYKKQSDKLRWSLKSVFVLHLLEKNPKVIYVDNDILFFGDPNFLFEELESSAILLTPHHYPRNPEIAQNWLEANFRVGLYNAGFIAANRDAKAVLSWWGRACLYRCEKNYWRGLYDDQKYLDLFPIIEPNTKVLNHMGCNVAAWNQELCPVDFKNNQFIVNKKTDLIFYHFNAYSFQELAADHKLITHYIRVLKKYKRPLVLKDLIPAKSQLDSLKLFIWKLLNRLNAK